MHVKSSAALLAITLLAPTAVTAQLIQSIVLPGFATGIANVSQGGVGTDGRTTFVAETVAPMSASGSASVTVSASIAAFTGTATMLVGSNGLTENKFQLEDGSQVDETCSYGNNQAACTAVVSNSATTFTTTFVTAVPTVQAAASSAPSVLHIGMKTASALLSVGLVAGLCL